MRKSGWACSPHVFVFVLSAVFVIPERVLACPERDERLARLCLNFDDGDKPGSSKKKKSGRNGKKSGKKQKRASKIRWGQRRSETDAEYDKRYQKILKRVQRDKKDDSAPGVFMKDTERIYLWTVVKHPFIIRTDIDKEFTADTAMYMEMLHRDYSEAYKRFLGVPAKVNEMIEVIVFADQATYMANGGSPGSGGFFAPDARSRNDRGPTWPARRFRLQQFTSGVTDFAKWPKGTLKHEAAHMELQLRLNVSGVHAESPRWFNEGHACVFEFWDFDKTVDENLKAVPDRGRYAPVIRRLYGTDKWKDFDYVWRINAQSWHGDMTSDQGFLNYAQSWSLAGFMMTSGREGRKHFREIYDITTRVGADRPKRRQAAGNQDDGNQGEASQGDGMQAWVQAFPAARQEELEKQWVKWVKANIRRDEQAPDEEFMLRSNGYNPKVVDRLEGFASEEEAAKNGKWIRKELKRRESINKVEK